MSNISKTKEMNKAINIINNSNNIFIASHINPDGDNLGSILALTLALDSINKNVYPLKSDDIPEDFLFLPGINRMEYYNENMGEIELLILVDTSDEDRLGANSNLIKKSKNVLNIDHHISNNYFGDINIVDPKAPATCEIIYKILEIMEVPITLDIATNLYTGINTDTGKFSYPGVTGETHRIVGELVDKGVDINKVNLNIYESMSMPKMRLFIKAMSSLNMYENNKIGTVKITQKMLEETGASMEDSSGIVNFIRKIEDVEVACLLKEIKKNEIKLSLRSKEYVDVSNVCKVFGGGGHIRASGCTINLSINNSEKEIVKEISKSLKKR